VREKINQAAMHHRLFVQQHKPDHQISLPQSVQSVLDRELQSSQKLAHHRQQKAGLEDWQWQ